MKLGTLVLTSALLAVMTANLSGQSAPASRSSSPEAASLAGVWRGQMDHSPAIVLTLTNESGTLSGAVLFYFHMRANVNEPYTVTPGIPEPIFKPKFDGKTIAFEVSHRRAHPPGSLSDPPVRFHLTLTGPDKALLVNEDEGGGGLPMVRSDW